METHDACLKVTMDFFFDFRKAEEIQGLLYKRRQLEQSGQVMQKKVFAETGLQPFLTFF